MKVKDIVIATGACTDSNYGANFGLKGNISAVPSFKLLKKADEISTKLGFKDKTKFGQILSSDIFYSDQPRLLVWTKIGVLAVEMKAYGLYLNATRAGKHALTIFSVSNNIVTNEELTAEERTKNVNEMIFFGYEIAADLG